MQRREIACGVLRVRGHASNSQAVDAYLRALATPALQLGVILLRDDSGARVAGQPGRFGLTPVWRDRDALRNEWPLHDQVDNTMARIKRAGAQVAPSLRFAEPSSEAVPPGLLRVRFTEHFVGSQASARLVLAQTLSEAPNAALDAVEMSRVSDPASRWRCAFRWSLYFRLPGR